MSTTRRRSTRVSLRDMKATGLLLLLTVGLAGCSESEPGAVAGSARGPHPGEETYNRYCFSCHAAGVANAPKSGDAEAWQPRIAKGEALLLQSTKAGITPGMPAMGLCLSCSDDELAAAIDYMIDGVGQP